MEKTNIIDTKTGKIQGYKEKNVEIFKGIPFAEPPIGELRFKPPVQKKKWDYILDATKYGAAAYQGYSQLEEIMGKPENESEDCLTLNIWTPATDNKKRPVMFWVHGGAFIIGSGTDPVYESSTLAKRGDIVVVTINYRLGAFGFLHVPGESVSVGSLDQIMALKWVKDNIASFGGDPDNITIFGESAGGYSVVTLCAMPATKGLIKRCIAHSAPYIDPTIDEKGTKKIMRKLRLKGAGLKAMMDLPPEKIIKAQNDVFASDPLNIMALRPNIDGEILPEHPLKVFREGGCKDIDFMIGTILEEAKLFIALEPKLANMIEAEGETLLIGYLAMQGVGADDTKKSLEVYKKTRSSSLDMLSAIITDIAFRVPTVRLLEAQKAHQPNTYNYIFTFKSPGFDGKDIGACHAIELPFVFGNYDSAIWKPFLGEGPELKEISEKMMDAWIAFARTGNPNTKNLPEWPAYDEKSRATMLIGPECKVENAVADEERKAWDGLLEVK